jgi:hypothetical protein
MGLDKRERAIKRAKKLGKKRTERRLLKELDRQTFSATESSWSNPVERKFYKGE